ncbi:TPA: hypothetical protein DDW35_11715 [Candidatus Sumerlaeota bacterium]|jgi:cysteine desulfurase / selenocysteine lyase|nr:hypothetical protein [Candidatus Sumerlaeota bacterium]
MPSTEIISQFIDPRREDYYNTAGITLLPLCVKDALNAYLTDTASDFLGAYGRHLALTDRVRANLATLMNAAHPNEVAITHHTAEGANVIVNGIRWNPGDKILSLNREYPSTIYPWMNAEKLHGVKLILLEEQNGRVDEQVIIDALRTHRPRLFALSAVEWNSGYRFDLESIGRACEELDIFFFVDAAQALGFTEVDVQKCRIKAMAGSAWKWLFGPPGQGYLYLRQDLLETITPVFVGSCSVPNPSDFSHYQFEFKPDSRRFEYSTASLSNIVWFDAALRFLLGIPRADLHEHVFGLQDYALEQLKSIGCKVRGDRPREQRSGIMAFQHPTIDSQTLVKRLLQEAGIFAQERDQFVRLAFHVYNTRAGIDRLLEKL